MVGNKEIKATSRNRSKQREPNDFKVKHFDRNGNEINIEEYAWSVACYPDGHLDLSTLKFFRRDDPERKNLLKR